MLPRAPRPLVLVVLGTLVLLVPLLLLVRPTGSASAASVRLDVPVAGDTYTESDHPSTNYGRSPRWSADGRPGSVRVALLRFDVPAAPVGSTYVSATLRAFSDTSARDGAGVVAYRTGDAWSEAEVTADDQPARGARLDVADDYPADAWVEWDVTSAVAGSGGVLNLRLETDAARWSGFESRENARGRTPVLRLVSQSLDATGPPSGPAPRHPGGTATTAAATMGWGTPVAGDEFSYSGAPDAARWSTYDSPGHAGRGTRSPEAWTVGDGVARVDGDADGTTGGMSATFGHRRYGRWEIRMRTSDRDPAYHPVAILWPDSGDWPCDGEIDDAEGTADTSTMHFFHHWSCANSKASATRALDSTQWHTYAVEWTPRAVVGYLDGQEWFRDDTGSHQPAGPMHQTLQLDWFPRSGPTAPAWMEVDWVRVYDLTSSDEPGPGPVEPPAPTPAPPVEPPAASGDVRLAVLGDVNHEGNSSASSREGRIAASISAWRPTAVALLGDQQYQYGDCASLVGDFDRTGWGTLLSRTIGTAGPTHDYTPSSGADYSRHMEGTCPGQSTGPSLSAQRWARTVQPYEPHAVDLGAWTVVSMPSAQWRDDYSDRFGQEWSGPALTGWLGTTVAAATARGDHVAVIEHEPYWSSGTSSHPASEGDAQGPWIAVLDRYDVPLLLAGHQHNYERFHPQDADGTRNDATGTQQFQVSTGGIGLRPFTSTAANSAARDASSYGWLQMELHGDGSYDWSFVPVEGSFTDTGHRGG